MKDEDLASEESWHRRRVRQALLFVTVPGVVVGVASISAAYSAGWMSPPPPPPVCKPEIVKAPARGSFTVNVMNATSKSGAAANVAMGLSKRKFRVGAISNAPESWYVTQSAVVHHGPDGLDQALLVADMIPGAKLFEDSRPGTAVDLVVGLAYKDMTPIPPRLKPYPREISVNVYNTTYKTGLAKVVAGQVAGRGFRIKEVTNDPLRTMQMGTAVIRYGEEGDLAAQLLAGHVPGAELVKIKRDGATVDLVIGNAFSTLVPTAQVPPLPERPKAEVPTVARPCED